MILFSVQLTFNLRKGETTMATKAIDMATILKALFALREEHLIGCGGWRAGNENQRYVLDLFEEHGRVVSNLNDLNCSTRVEGTRIIVEALLDKSVKWLEGNAKSETIKVKTSEYPAFILKQGCSVFKVAGFENPLLMVKTKNGDNLWMMMVEKEFEGMDLVHEAFEIIKNRGLRHPEYISSPDAIIPKVDFNLEPDISFLIGASTSGGGESWVIDEAKQKFKFRMNEEGARAVVESRLGVLGCCIDSDIRKRIITIDKPFIGFFTQGNYNFPLAIFYADFDSWKNAGKLRAL